MGGGAEPREAEGEGKKTGFRKKTGAPALPHGWRTDKVLELCPRVADCIQICNRPKVKIKNKKKIDDSVIVCHRDLNP